MIAEMNELRRTSNNLRSLELRLHRAIQLGDKASTRALRSELLATRRHARKAAAAYRNRNRRG